MKGKVKLLLDILNNIMKSKQKRPLVCREDSKMAFMTFTPWRCHYHDMSLYGKRNFAEAIEVTNQLT